MQAGDSRSSIVSVVKRVGGQYSRGAGTEIADGVRVVIAQGVAGSHMLGGLTIHMTSPIPVPTLTARWGSELR
jgi:hypothetical protein